MQCSYLLVHFVSVTVCYWQNNGLRLSSAIIVAYFFISGMRSRHHITFIGVQLVWNSRCCGAQLSQKALLQANVSCRRANANEWTKVVRTIELLSLSATVSQLRPTSLAVFICLSVQLSCGLRSLVLCGYPIDFLPEIVPKENLLSDKSWYRCLQSG